MVIELTMPRLSDTMEQGTIIRWNVKEGDAVSAGDAVADVETDKATMEMQVYDDGTIGKILVPEGRTVDVGTVIALVAEKGEDAGKVASAAGAAAVKAAAKAEGKAPARPAQPRDGDGEGEVAGEGDGRRRISPVARRVADEHGIDVATIQGSGPSGRIIKRDVLRAVEASAETAAAIPPAARRGLAATPARGLVEAPAAAPEAPPAPAAVPEARDLVSRTVPLSGMRQTIARRLVESTTTIPHYQVTVSFDMDALMSLRATLNEQLAGQGLKLSVNDFLVRGCALAMHRHPEFNASFGGDHIEIHGEVNVGLAISIPAERGGGLVVGVIRDADRKSLRLISLESRQLAEQARSRGLTIEQMQGATFTLSNLGMFGVDNFTAIINPPNTAILAVGAAMKKPVVRGGEVVVGQEMSATGSFDHRVIDGAMAAAFLQTLKQFVENPATLLV